MIGGGWDMSGECVLIAPGQVLALYRLINSKLIVQMEYDHERDESLLLECLGGLG